MTRITPAAYAFHRQHAHALRAQAMHQAFAALGRFLKAFVFPAPQTALRFRRTHGSFAVE